MGTYLVLAVAYYLFVVRVWEVSEPWAMQSLFVVLTSALLVFWNARRLNDVRHKAIEASKAAELAKAAAPAGA